MALPSSGAISLANIQTEFGGSNPIGLNEYYRDGAYVGAGAPNVPTSGLIDLQDFYGAQAAIVLDITSNASEQNILTLATAAGYTAATDSTPIIVNIASGVTISGSTTHALRTGALNANSDLTINISGSVDGYTGALGGSAGAAGLVGGDALFFETLTGGTGTYIVNVLSGANLRGGGGGGGRGGNRGIRGSYYDNKYGCEFATPVYGSFGSNGAAGGFGQAGSSGGSGSYGGGTSSCPIQSPTGGGAGGAAGFAARFGGRTVTVNNSGTIAGSTA
uniref:Phage tail protein n=1 Tax=uncultured marine virus TaxID=186617 RepID=A0A0F7L754_9VIRU|nr:hypothetical protein [uncultured marine virus]